ncbi:hypothetical protein VVR84_03950 [Kocuria carniphila]|uniref:Uncharacterized protein n=1 Tax=Kocuria carniphila TaxID=262208 RepID=A0ABV3V068_9MICC
MLRPDVGQGEGVPLRSKLIFTLWVVAIVFCLWVAGTIISGNRANDRDEWLHGVQENIATNVGASQWENACAESRISWVCSIRSMEATDDRTLTVYTDLWTVDSREAWGYGLVFTEPDWVGDEPAEGVVIVDRQGIEKFYSKRIVDKERYD